MSTQMQRLRQARIELIQAQAELPNDPTSAALRVMKAVIMLREASQIVSDAIDKTYLLEQQLTNVELRGYAAGLRRALRRL